MYTRCRKPSAAPQIPRVFPVEFVPREHIRARGPKSWIASERSEAWLLLLACTLADDAGAECNAFLVRACPKHFSLINSCCVTVSGKYLIPVKNAGSCRIHSRPLSHSATSAAPAYLQLSRVEKLDSGLRWTLVSVKTLPFPPGDEPDDNSGPLQKSPIKPTLIYIHLPSYFHSQDDLHNALRPRSLRQLNPRTGTPPQDLCSPCPRCAAPQLCRACGK